MPTRAERLYNEKVIRYTATSPCPECGHKGPHQDNGQNSLTWRTYLCTSCWTQFDAITVKEGR